MMLQALRNIWRSEFFRNLGTLISGTTFAQAFSVLIYTLLSGIYTDAAFGVFGLYMNILALSVIFSTAKYELAILLPKDEKESLNVLGLSLGMSLIVSMLLLLLILFFRQGIAALLGSEEIIPWLWYIPLSTFMVGLFQSFRNYSNRQKRYRLIAGANISQSMSNSLTKLGWGWIVAGGLGNLIAGPAGLIAGAIIGQTVGLLTFLVVHIRKGSVRWDWISLGGMREMALRYRLFPRFNMLQGLINNFSSALPVFIFSRYFTLEVVGFYTFGHMVIFRPVNLVANAFYQLLYQRFTSRLHQGLPVRQEVRFYLRRSILVLIPLFVLAAIFWMDLFALLFDDSKLEAGRYALIMMPWFFTVLLTMPLSFVPDLYRRQRGAMIIDAVKLVLRISGLAIGVIAADVYLALAVFSGLSVVMNIFSLGWYLYLLRINEGKEVGQ